MSEDKTMAELSEETCMCGDPMDGHSALSGHLPVSMADYYDNTDQHLTNIGDFIRDLSANLGDEGDRVYLGSTNDADRLREWAAWFHARMYRGALKSTESE